MITETTPTTLERLNNSNSYSSPFPDPLSVGDAYRLKNVGLKSIGRVLAITTLDGLLLVADHDPDGNNGKVDTGYTLAPLSETVAGTFDKAGRLTSVETFHQTIIRCLQTELGIKADESLPLFCGRKRPPVALRGGDMYGETAILFLPSYFTKRSRDKFVNSFKPTTEIRGIEFMPTDKLLLKGNSRPYVHPWLVALSEKGEFSPNRPLERILLPAPQDETDLRDIKLDELKAYDRSA